MLTYEALIDNAKTRGLPANKLRGILREYLQILVLKEISRSGEGKNLYFLGGTYLRFVHNIKRFSEDLDFNAYKLKEDDFNRMINAVKKELGRMGILSKIKFGHRKNLLISNITFPEIESAYGVSAASGHKGLMIKAEANCPAYKPETTTHVVSGFGEMFPVICMKPEYIFAEKVDAMVKKSRGRHIYDVIFMLANNFSVSKKILLYNNIKQDPSRVIADRINSFSAPELRKLANSLRPFLFDEKESELVAGARVIIPDLLNKNPIKIC